MLCNLKIQPVPEQLQKLNSQKTPLCQHTTFLFNTVAEIRFQLGIHDHNCFPKERADFRTANIKHIANFCNIRNCHIRPRSHQTIP